MEGSYERIEGGCIVQSTVEVIRWRRRRRMSGCGSRSSLYLIGRFQSVDVDMNRKGRI